MTTASFRSIVTLRQPRVERVASRRVVATAEDGHRCAPRRCRRCIPIAFRYGAAYGRLGRIVMALLGLAVAAIVASMAAAAIIPQSSRAYGVLWGLGDVAFMAMFPIATAVGLVL